MEQRIRERAYEIYLSRNGEGDEVSDWLTAERELKSLNGHQLEAPGPRKIQRQSIKKAETAVA